MAVEDAKKDSISNVSDSPPPYSPPLYGSVNNFSPYINSKSSGSSPFLSPYEAHSTSFNKNDNNDFMAEPLPVKTSISY